jgi:hypothetical protein
MSCDSCAREDSYGRGQQTKSERNTTAVLGAIAGGAAGAQAAFLPRSSAPAAPAKPGLSPGLMVGGAVALGLGVLYVATR